jgi:hypothetical protein
MSRARARANAARRARARRRAPAIDRENASSYVFTMRFHFLVGTLVVSSSLLLVHCVGDSSTSEPPASDSGGGSDGTTGTADGAMNGTDGSTMQSMDGSAPSDASQASDVVDAGPQPACDLTKPFGPPNPVTAINTANNESAARISATGLELFVSRTLLVGAANIGYIFRYVRATPADPWTLAEQDSTLSTEVDGGPTTAFAMTLTPDGLTGYYQYYADSVASGTAHLSTVTRSSTSTGSWSTEVPVAVLNSIQTDEQPFLSPNGDAIYFQSARSGGFHLFYSPRTDAGTFMSPVSPFVAQPSDDRTPAVTGDELTLYYASFTSLDGGANVQNVFKATRNGTGVGFGAGVDIPELNSPGHQTTVSWVSPDGCTILISSDRTGNFDIFQAVKPK